MPPSWSSSSAIVRVSALVASTIMGRLRLGSVGLLAMANPPRIRRFLRPTFRSIHFVVSRPPGGWMEEGCIIEWGRWRQDGEEKSEGKGEGREEFPPRPSSLKDGPTGRRPVNRAKSVAARTFTGLRPVATPMTAGDAGGEGGGGEERGRGKRGGGGGERGGGEKGKGGEQKRRGGKKRSRIITRQHPSVPFPLADPSGPL